MKIFDKLTSILFDEQPEDIPVITKSDEKKEEKKAEKHKNNDDEVLITKIEHTPQEETFSDMPKLSDEKKEEKSSVFNFPLIDDDEFDVKDEKREKRKREDSDIRGGYDYLSSIDYNKKSDSYTASRNNIYDKSEGKKPFTLSPIISPVYGILNENYKKEDIIERNSSRTREKIDLDSVRRKAYGTLEEEIEVSLNKNDILDEVPEKDDMTLENLSDDGLSINDLLVEKDIKRDDEEIFDIGEDIPKEVDIDEDIDNEPEVEEQGEEDLFDLIDSIYAGKDEE